LKRGSSVSDTFAEENFLYSFDFGELTPFGIMLEVFHRLTNKPELNVID